MNSVPAGAASGFGVLPGTDVDEVVRSIAGELTELPFQPDLPARGVGADPVGRCVADLVDIAAEVVPSGWRISSRPGRDVVRAKDFRSWDADAVELHLQGAPALKVQVLGPWTLAARLELRSGHRVVTDAGAVADLTVSYAEGLAERLADLSLRLPGTAIRVQLDEPELSRVLAGTLPTASGFGTVRSVAGDVVRARLGGFVDAVSGAANGAVTSVALSGVHPGEWWTALRKLGVSAFTVELGALGQSDVLDAVGEAVSEGAALQVLWEPSARPDTPERVTRTLLAVWRALGFPMESLASAALPVSGAPAAVAGIASALRHAAEIGRALIDPPTSWTQSS